jgi:hypothetical protein
MIRDRARLTDAVGQSSTTQLTLFLSISSLFFSSITVPLPLSGRADEVTWAQSA